MNREQRHDSATKRKRIELVVQQLESVPTLPAVAARLMQITVDPRTQAQEVVRLIESDPSLASKMISLAANAGTGVRSTQVSVSKAVVLLGFDAIRNAALSIKVFDVLPSQQPSDTNAASIDWAGLWKHSLAVACAARILIPYVDPAAEPEEAFVCGLLHDIGKLGLAVSLPKSFARVVQLTDSSLGDIADVEREIFGLDHTIAGKRLAEKWRLPGAILETVWLHHQGPDALPDDVSSPAMVQAVHLADLLARQHRLGYSGNHNTNIDAVALAEQLHCPAEALQEVNDTLCENMSERAALLGLDDLEPEELYREALADANQYLGRLNQRLNQQNRDLSARSDYFQLLVDLNDSLQAELSVAEVCRFIAELWQTHAGCDSCAVYSADSQNFVIEGAVKPDAQSQATVFLLDRADDPDLAAGDEPFEADSRFAITPAPSNCSWLFEQVLTDFDIDRTLTMPLQCGGRTLGGIFWQGGPEQRHCQDEILEIQAFSAVAANAIQYAHRQEQAKVMSEQLAQLNRQLQQSHSELLQKRSLAAVGEMVCGAAHEINNPLAVMVGRAQLLMSNDTDDQCRKMAETISRKGDEITQIITELLEFAQPPEPQPAAVPAERLIAASAVAVGEYAQEHEVSIEIDPCEDLPEMLIDYDQCFPALAEIITNAINSYQEQGGAVRITTREDELAGEIVLEIADQGCGMDQQTLNQAFTPFFSARQAGRGRGLGLSRTSRCIEANGGRLSLASEVGRGTTAQVRLPISHVGPQAEIAVQ